MRQRSLDLPPEVSDDTLKAFLRLYQLETWIREMVYLELKSYYGMHWLNEAESALARSNVNIRMASKSATKDKRHQHISTAENNPLWYMSFDSLLKIVFDPKMWKLFESYFTTKKLFRARFEEIAPIRNRVAHCRALHAYDLDRLIQFLRDFDQGFWRFCASYGDQYVFVDKLARNGVFEHFKAEQAENLRLYYSARPSVGKRAPKPQLGPGLNYDVTIITHHHGRYFEYDQILKLTKPLHKYLLHIMLDAFQSSLRITFPGTLDATTVVDAVERFVHVAHNAYSVVPLVPLVSKAEADKSDSKQEDFWTESRARNRPFELIAAVWPHYVLPPSHPFTFIDSACPCNFFGA